jgi:hypothetical protein
LDKPALRYFLHGLTDPGDSRAYYRYAGSIDLTSDVNFAVLEKVAKEDGLTPAMSGSQNELLLKSGLLRVLMEKYEPRYYRPGDYGGFFFDNMSIALDQFKGLKVTGDYYSHLLIKDIDVNDLHWDKYMINGVEYEVTSRGLVSAEGEVVDFSQISKFLS